MSRFTHLKADSSDDEEPVSANPTREHTQPPVASSPNDLYAVPTPPPHSEPLDAPTDDLNTTQERIIPSESGSPLGDRVAPADGGAEDGPPSSAFIDCVSAGATYSQITPQRSVGDQILHDLMGSAQAPVSNMHTEHVEETAAANPVAPSEPARASLLSPAEGDSSPSGAQLRLPPSPSPSPSPQKEAVFHDSAASATAQADAAAPPLEEALAQTPDTPVERRVPDQESSAVLEHSGAAPAIDAGATSTSNADSATITSGKGVLRSLYLDQQRRQQRQRLHQSQFSQLSPDDAQQPRDSRGSSSAAQSESLPDPNRDSRGASVRSTGSTTPSGRRRRAESLEWAQSQQLALEHLRAELDSTSQTPSRHAGGRLTPRARHAHADTTDPSVLPPITATTAPAVQAPSPSPLKDPTLLTFRPNLSAISNISPVRNEVPSILAELYGQSPYSQVPREVAELSPFHEDDRDEQLQLLRGAQAAYASPPQDPFGHPTPMTSSAPLAASSEPEPTVLKWMPREGKTFTTPSRRASPARSVAGGAADTSTSHSPHAVQRQQQKSPGRGKTQLPRVHVSNTTTQGRQPQSQHSQNITSASGRHHVPAIDVEARERKLRKLRAETDAKEMAECTFHPVISPGTRAMVELSRLGDAAPGAGETDSIDETSASAAALNEPVFERLYPEKLLVAASQKKQVEAEMEARQLARQEMLSLRRRCRAPFKVETPEASFDVFLSNVLGRDCYDAGALVSSTYKSPMAVALIEEKAARRRLAERRRTELRDDVEDSQEFRIALFDEFLLRQNAHYFNKARTIQQLERHLTPSFTPETTDTSARIVKRLVERSMLDETIDPAEKAELKQRHARGEPIASALVRKHRSKYEDPCTFHPVISRYAAGSPEKQTGKAPGSPSSPRSNQGPSGSTAPRGTRKKAEMPRYEVLYQEHKRLATNRRQEREKAAQDEVKDCTFQPTNLNRKRNAKVTSFVEEPSYSQHEAQMRQRQQKRAALHAEQTLLEEERESQECTFRPRVTKTPAYISRMAKSFGVIRTQDTEL